MCLVPDAKSPNVLESSDARAAAAADAAQMSRKNAQGFGASMFGGINDTGQPSLSRQMLGMG